MTRWRRLTAVGLLLTVCLSVGVGSVAASPGVSPTTLIAGRTYHLTEPLHGHSLDTVKVVGAATLTHQSVSNGDLHLTVKPANVSEKRSATLIIMFSGGSQSRQQLSIFPQPSGSQPGTGRISKQQVKNAKAYKQLKSNWIETRVRYVKAPNGHAKEIEYQQLDPTKGQINPKTGVPEGKWVTVPVNKQGNPEWLFQTPAGYSAYAASQAATKRSYRQSLLLGAIALVLIGWSIPVLIYAYRYLSAEAVKYREVGPLGVLYWKLRGNL